MKRFLLAALVPLFFAPVCWGQFSPPQDQAQSLAARKARRDEAVRVAGPDAADFCRHYGDLGVNAILRCAGWSYGSASSSTADLAGGPKALVAFSKGKLQSLPDPLAALTAVAQHGRPVCAWMIEHHEALLDPVAFAAWIAYADELGADLLELDQAIARRQAHPPQSPVWKLPAFLPQTWQDAWPIIIGGGAGIGIVYLGRRWWRQRNGQPIQGPGA